MKPTTTRKPGRYRRVALGLVAFCLAIVALIWYAAARHIALERQEAIDEAIRQNNNLALAFERHTVSTLKTAEQALLHLARTRAPGARAGGIGALLADGHLDPQLFAFAAIVDAGGTVLDVAGSRAALAGRTGRWLARHRGLDDERLFIGTAVYETDEGPVIPLTQRLSGPGGGFGGVAVVGLRQRHFTDFYNLVDLKAHGMVLLLGPDATVLARRTGASYSFGSRIPESEMVRRLAEAPAGHYVTRGRADGVPRFLSYRAVSGSPLVVAVGTAVDEMMAEATARRHEYLARASLVTVLIALFAAGGVLALRRQGAATTAALRSEVYYRATFDQAAIAIAHVRLDGRFLRANAAFCRLLGYEERELLERTIVEVTHPADLAHTADSVRRLAEERGALPPYEKRYLRKDGATVWVIVAPALVRDAERGSEYVLNMVQDISERKLAEERRAAHLRYQERIARYGHDALGVREAGALVDMAAQTLLLGLQADAIAYVEPAPGERRLLVRALAGAAQEEAGESAAYDATHAIAGVLAERRPARLEGAAAAAALPFAWARGMTSAVLAPVRNESAARGALCALAAGERRLRQEEVGFAEAVASILSAGLQRLDSESRLAFLAQFDSLTGLPNRALFADRFSQALAQAKRGGTLVGVLFVDLDHFKLVNDSLGHAAGDELLREAAQRLQAAVRAGDTVARISGDEFAVILAGLERAEDAAPAAARALAGLGEPVVLRGQEVYVTASIGAAAFPADGDTLDSLLAAADAAMYRAKQSGRNAFQFFTPEINARTNARLQMASELRHALERGELALAYQPKLDLKSGRPCGAEALLRWNHPERGLVGPAQFVPVLEETGLILPAGEWVLERACRDLRAWMDAGLEPLPVAVNLSARQLAQPQLDERIAQLLAAQRVPPSLVELEITESQIVKDPEHAVRVMRALVAQGVRLAIDDFGTGYSSLAYLTQFPVAALKIDRSFVADALEDQADAVIVRTIVEMGHTLGFTVVAEGVEQEAQAAFLRSLGCDVGQGFLFGRPMAEAELRKLMRPRSPLAAA